uniref:Uncharacterized protein n=1 Tax=Anguilla anguilla TaxID=7936 RepID=A0A0E9RD08_ANGAN
MTFFIRNYISINLQVQTIKNIIQVSQFFSA